MRLPFDMGGTFLINSFLILSLHCHKQLRSVNGILPLSKYPFPLRDESLITCGEGVEDILVYLTEFSSPISNLCKYIDPHSRISEETP